MKMALSSSRLNTLDVAFPNYLFRVIPADDIRDKESVTRPSKEGLLDKKLVVKPALRPKTEVLLDELASYFG